MKSRLGIIYTTVASLKEAERLAEQAVVLKLAACVNIVPQAVSIYEWEGKLENSQEALIIFKTAIAKQQQLYTWLVENHPYSVPAIIKFEADTSTSFSDYIKAQVKVI